MFFPIQMHDRNLIAVIHGRNVKMWDKDLIREFAEDFESDDEEGDKKDEVNVDEDIEQDIVIKGPLNYLFPIMLKQCFYEVFSSS
jgi:hypothetical protein